MKGLDTGKDKIQKICDLLKKETLDPARQEGREIVENAHLQAAEIVSEAEAKSARILQEAMAEMEEKKRVFHSSLQLACRQGIEQIKQKIEKELFYKELASIVETEMSSPKVVADLLSGFMKAIEERGIEDEFSVTIPKGIAPRAITELLVRKVLSKLENETAHVGDFGGGVEVHLKKRQITLSITDEVVREMIAQYIRRDLRDLVFAV